MDQDPDGLEASRGGQQRGRHDGGVQHDGAGHDGAGHDGAGLPRASRSAPRLLVDANYGPFLLGKTLSTMGMWMHNIAAAIVVYDATRSVVLVGAVTAGHALPQLLLAPWSGARADSGDRRRQVAAGVLLAAGGSGGLAALVWLAGLAPLALAAAVICASTLVGVGFALSVPAQQALLPALVDPADLPNAVAFGGLPHTVARAAGPVVGALLVTTAGPVQAFGAAALAHLGFATSLALLSVRQTRRRARGDRSVRAGWRYVRSDALMVPLLLSVAAVGYGVDPVITLSPAIADGLGLGAEFVGTLASAFGVGAGLALVALPSARRALGIERLGAVGLGMMATAMLALATLPGPVLALATMCTSGAGHTLALATLTTAIQQRVPEEFRGRVMASWTVAYLGSRGLASITLGVTADLASHTVALLLVVVVAAAGTWLARPARLAGAVPRG